MYIICKGRGYSNPLDLLGAELNVLDVGQFVREQNPIKDRTIVVRLLRSADLDDWRLMGGIPANYPDTTSG
ncbi:hypothetical protein PFI31113_03371 [Pandoraea fibrosis]|uniref:Uncharacterized protein n=1 Tax=Pandoraea fibrosis TaxID=1891094 RepID=A0A5E4WR57_9BURK|nr:hypothetical protein PFI31113_03371 [Pandoraea fibrosis]